MALIHFYCQTPSLFLPFVTTDPVQEKVEAFATVPLRLACVPNQRLKYYPFIHSELKKTKYRFIPYPDDVEITSSWSGADLARTLVFMLFDDLNYSFFRGTLSCTKVGFFLEREFFLGLPQNTNPSFIFRILKDERFSGNPPSLHIESSTIYPDWNTFHFITLNDGKGFEFKGWTLHNMAKEHIETTIHDSIAMYEESMIEGMSIRN